MSSAEILRRAAALMRERATAATPGPWSCDDKSGIDDLHFGHVGLPVLRGPNSYGPSLADTQHMAGMDPLVALALAEWLEEAAEDTDMGALELDKDPDHPALAVARAYFGETP